jgi:ABC-type multidrug transport system ATPase subunit
MTAMERITHISVKEVTKLFGAQAALKQVSLEVHSGETVGIIGRNGAGKSTLLSILSTVMKATYGGLEVNGAAAGPQLRSRIGVLSHKALVYPELTCEENLNLFADLYGVERTVVTRLAKQLFLTDFFSDRAAGVLSRGQLQRLSLARALIASPDVLLLDEPSSGLDGQSIRLIETLVQDHREQSGISFVVSHDPALVAKLCTRVVLLVQGKIETESGVSDATEIARMLEEGTP